MKNKSDIRENVGDLTCHNMAGVVLIKPNWYLYYR